MQASTSMEENEGQDKKSQCKDGAANCTKAIRSFSHFLLHRQVFERIHIVPKHFES